MEISLPCRAIVCGDSIAAGVIYDETTNRYKKHTKGFIKLLAQNWNGSLINLGRFGNTISNALPRLNHQIEKEKPHLVFIELGGNDCDFQWEEIAASPKSLHIPATPVEVFENVLFQTVRNLLKQNIVPILCTLPPIDAERYFTRISKGRQELAQPILEWLGSVSRIYWWHERYNAAILTVADKTNSHLIDFRSPFLLSPDYRKLICPDGIHPNETGQALLYKIMKDDLCSHYPNLLSIK